MKIILFTQFLLLFGFNGFSKYSSNDISKYYELINKAELSIIDNNLEEASAYYDKSFQLKAANHKDLKNAFSVAYQLGDSIMARKYANILTAHGISPSYTWIALDSANNPHRFNYVLQDRDSVLNKVKYKYKQMPVTLFDSLNKIDQNVRINDVSKDSLKKADNIVAKLVTHYIKSNGYPTLDSSGTHGAMYNVIYNCFILIWHMRDRDSFPELDSLLSQELLKGNLAPDEWMAFMLNRKGYHEKYGNAIWRIDWSKITPQQKAEINKNRAKLNLESIEDYKKKYDYEQQLQQQYGCTRYGHKYQFLDPFLVPPSGIIKEGY